jgi:hypothetical protein
MTDSITPPPELALQWINEYLNEHPEGVDVEVLVVNAAQWGADQELEACLRLVEIDAGEDAYDFARYIRAARRPKPPSLKEQALKLARPAGTEGAHVTFGPEELKLIRRALEALPE